MDATKKRGRPSLIPAFMELIHDAPEGQPIVLQAFATEPALAYHHRRNLANHGIDAAVVAPGKSKPVGKGLVKNPTDRYALIAVGTGPRRRKGKWIKIRNTTVKTGNPVAA